jgi:hypothetical protein
MDGDTTRISGVRAVAVECQGYCNMQVRHAQICGSIRAKLAIQTTDYRRGSNTHVRGVARFTVSFQKAA